MAGMTATNGASRRLLLVHAHPDDESIANGATMAKYTADGVHVTLLTCTRGEEGLVLVPELEHLAARRDDRLGEHRESELAAAMAALGVHDHRFLDTVRVPSDDGRPEPHYRDSGMAWDADHRAVPAPDSRPDAFARADLDEAAARVAAVVREVRPHVLLTYEPGGGYGHPDHVQAHRVAMRGAQLAAEGTAEATDDDPDRTPGRVGGGPWRVPKIYWTVLPESLVRSALARLAATGEAPPGWRPDGPLPSVVVPDELVTTVVHAEEYLDAKAAALRAHATQVIVDGDVLVIGDGARQPLAGVEFYRLVQGVTAGPRDGEGRETDLFAGLAGIG
jgi:N-acetyl-1-D-myo-inositol-2-amino-2-deoxy-alpha-D-glucopyranoside deacetylase